jgi:hypothetical protein
LLTARGRQQKEFRAPTSAVCILHLANFDF